MNAFYTRMERFVRESLQRTPRKEAKSRAF
jgi:hypothetical protein